MTFKHQNNKRLYTILHKLQKHDFPVWERVLTFRKLQARVQDNFVLVTMKLINGQL